MSLRKPKPFASLAVTLSCAILLLAPLAARGGASAARPDTRPPKIVAAALLDTNGDFRADRVRLVYSERIRHARDRDGTYPFAVSGYRVRSIGAATGKTLLVFLIEKAAPDQSSRPAIRYRRTLAKPVLDRAGNQAIAQFFGRVRAHGHTPPTDQAPPASNPAPTPTPLADSDGDGTPDTKDCAPHDASIHPGAADLPDLSFVDSNCDGIDGTETDAVFVSPKGNDANPGTKAKPKLTIRAGMATVEAGDGRYVLVAAGQYGHLDLDKNDSGVGIYGGYDPGTWSRRSSSLTVIRSIREAVYADGAKGVVLQLLHAHGDASAIGESAYGIRAVNGSKLVLQGVTVSAGSGAVGDEGANGYPPAANGGAGGSGDPGSCDDAGIFPIGGAGGSSPAGQHGGQGGWGGNQDEQPADSSGGGNGTSGKGGAPGGAGGLYGDPGATGLRGSDGANGAAGFPGFGGSRTAVAAGLQWAGQSGGIGNPGQPGNGGGGGGGGGGQTGFFVDDGAGNAGGGGGGGGAGGLPGHGGAPGGGSFGVYLYASSIVVESSTVQANDGGHGGLGGYGGAGGSGGAGGGGGTNCTSEVGRGGDGGNGGDGGPGGHGGGGAGGPSIGIFKTSGSTAELHHSKIEHGAGGVGGVGGGGGSDGQSGIALDDYRNS